MRVFYALARALGMKMRDVPVPAEAIEMMRDVLANTTSTKPAAVTDTSMGKHNLNMNGNEPIAHSPLRLRGGAPKTRGPLHRSA